MNQALRIPVDKPTFYRWVVEQEGRFELENGRVVDRTGASKNHNRLVTNLIVELHRKLDAVVWSITACYMAVEIGDNVRFPDVVVERLDAPGSELVAGQPAVLVEVLSPSSVARHMRGSRRRGI